MVLLYLHTECLNTVLNILEKATPEVQELLRETVHKLLLGQLIVIGIHASECVVVLWQDIIAKLLSNVVHVRLLNLKSHSDGARYLADHELELGPAHDLVFIEAEESVN